MLFCENCLVNTFKSKKKKDLLMQVYHIPSNLIGVKFHESQFLFLIISSCCCSDEACTSGQLVIASRESQYKILHFHHAGLDKLAEVFQQWKCCRETQLKDQVRSWSKNGIWCLVLLRNKEKLYIFRFSFFPLGVS